MKRIRLLGVAFMAVFAMGTILAGAASGEELTRILPLPTSSSPVEFTGKSGTGTLETAKKETPFECEEDSSTTTFTSTNLGTGHVTFGKKCKGPLSSTCTGEGDTSGSILTLGTVHFWLMLRRRTLVSGFAFLIKEFHFTCESLGVKQLVLEKGCLAGEQTSEERLTATAKLLYKQSAGHNEITEVLPENATKEINCSLETNVNGKGFEASGEGTEETNEKVTQGGKEITALLMR